MSRPWTIIAVAAAAFALAAPAAAAETVSLTTGGSNLQTSKSFASGNVKVKATAFSINSNNVIKTAGLASWGDGLGVTNPGKDNSHTVDNSGWTDFIVFQFDTSVILNSVAFRTGWHNMRDTDASIGNATIDWAANKMAWNGDVTSLFNNKNATFLGGFNLQHANSIGTGNETRQVNIQGATGNLWIVSTSLINSDKAADGFKVQSLGFAVSPTAVPEPSTWAVLILGMGMVGAAMRRRNRARLAFA